jgi:L-methionine (R)-S-oxide reductase
MYNDIKRELKGLLGGEKDFIANVSNFCSLIYTRIKSLNWVGFYFLKENELILGPFQGKPACIRIALGKGVCGTSALNRETLVVPDVHKFDGHITCDSASNSEIVIPLIEDVKLIGVLDIDSPAFDRFTKEDKKGLEELVELFLKSCDTRPIEQYYS